MGGARLWAASTYQLSPDDDEHLAAELVKGRDTPVAPWRFGPVE